MEAPGSIQDSGRSRTTAPPRWLVVIYPWGFTGRSRMRVARSQSWLFMPSTMSADNFGSHQVSWQQTDRAVSSLSVGLGQGDWPPSPRQDPT